MIQLNLLPDIKKEFIRSQKTKNMVISVSILATMGVVGLTVLLFIYVNLVQRLQLASADGDIKNRTTELKNIADVDKYLTVQNQLKSLPALHDAKPIYSRLFSILPVLNPGPPNNVTLTSLAIVADTKTITFTGTTRSFESFNIFVDTLKNAEATYKESADGATKKDKVFDSVTATSAGLTRTASQEVVSFVVQAIYKEPVFNTKTSGVTVSIPNIQTTESVTKSPKPSQVFDGATPTGGGQ